MEKKCFKCGNIKDLDEYYKHPAMGDGHLNKCKTCTKMDSTKRRNEKIEECRAYDRERGSLPHRISARKEYVERMKKEKLELWKKRRSETGKRYKKKHREKYLAKNKFLYHYKKGDIKKKNCIVCGSDKSEAHHPDYNYPLSVVWLCDKHHKEEHVKLRRKERRRDK